MRRSRSVPLSPRPRPRSRPHRSAIALAGGFILIATMSACANPRSEAATAAALSSAADEIAGLRNDVSQMQTDLDSLRQVVAHQDTVISRLAAINNVPR